jgi:predicted ribosomally synthesized peptide with nif11-like leader
MALQSAKDFLSKMQADPSFAQKVVEAASRDERRALIGGQGFDFTLTELESAVAEITESLSEELSSTDLAAVAGGASRSGGNTFFSAAIKGFRLGFTSGSSVKCDSSGSEGECVC